MLKKNIETFIGCNCNYKDANIVIFGAPFDSTTSFRPGARFGSSAIRHESFGLETYSPYLDSDLSDKNIFDSGDIELCFGNSNSALKMIEKRTDSILKDRKKPVMLGGEHLVTLGAIKAVVKQFPNINIIHFDAHADLRDKYLGEHLSHACVMRRCYELIGKGKIHQFCIRSGDKSEFQFAKNNTNMHKFNFDCLEETISKIQKYNFPVYFTIDLDCLDPSCFPGTGTPEAGGVSFNQLLRAINTVLANCNVVAADITELAPMLDTSGASTATACKILRELLLQL